MKWLKRRLRNWLNNYEEDSSERVYTTLSSNSVISRSDIDSENGLSITIRTAIGGRVVTFRTYDNKTDRHNYKLYVIPEDQDFERELGKIITLESMRY